MSGGSRVAGGEWRVSGRRTTGIIESVRGGLSQRAAARRFGVTLLTVQRWLERAGDRPLAEVEWSDRPSAPRRQRGAPR